MGLGALIDIPKEPPLNDSVVREFFTNLHHDHLNNGDVMVRKTKVKFTSKIINALYGLPEYDVDIPDYQDAIKELEDASKDPLETIRKKIDLNTPWTLTATNERKEIATVNWPEDWRVKCRFIQSRLLPKSNVGHFGIDDLELLYALTYKLVINVGKCLWNAVATHLNIKDRCLMVPYLIHRLCHDAGVPEYTSDRRPKRLPHDIQREKKRMELLAKNGIGKGASSSKAPTEPRKLDHYRMHLTIARGLSKFCLALQESQKVLIHNQNLIAAKLGTETLGDIITAPFDYNWKVEEAIEWDALTDDEQGGDSDEPESDGEEESSSGASSSGDGEEAAGGEEDSSDEE